MADLLGIGVLVVGIVATLFFAEEHRAAELNRVAERLRAEVSAEAEGLREDLEARLLALDRMAARFGVADGLPEMHWRRDAANYRAHQPGYETIAWVDADGEVVWAEPRSQRPLLQFVGPERNPAHAATLQAARRAGTGRLSGPVKLADGAAGFLAASPALGENRFLGFMVGVFRTRALFESMDTPTLAGSFWRRIYHDGELVVPAGREARFDGAMPSASAPFQIRNALWRIDIVPRPGSPLGEMAMTYPWSILLVGTLLSGLAALLTRTLLRAHDRLRRLVASEQSLEAIVAAVPEAVVTLDSTGRIWRFSPGAEAMFRCPAADRIGQPLDVLFAEEERDGRAAERRHRRAFNLPLSGREVRHCWAVRADGERFPVWMAEEEIERGAERFTLVILRDQVGGGGRAASADSPGAGLAVRLRTPLTSVLGGLANVRARFADRLGEDGRELLDIVQTNAERLGMLLTDLMDGAGRSGQDIDIAPRVQTLLPIVHAAMTSLTEHARARGVMLRLEACEEACLADVDAHRLQQVISSLLVRAVNVSPTGANVAVSLAQADGAVRLAVHDAGPALGEIDGGRRERGSAAVPGFEHQPPAGGSMSLELARAVIERHNGELWYSDSVGGGVTAWVDLPRDRGG